MTNIARDRTSSYLEHLPAIFDDGADQRGVTFVGRFLLAFEQMLTGLGEDLNRPGLEEILDGMRHPVTGELLIAGVHRYFDPGPNSPVTHRAPAEFLPWLAGCVALSLRDDWTEDEQRRFISRIVSLYRLRGTKAGLEQMLETYTGLGATINEDDARPHYFRVELMLNVREPEVQRRKERIARAIINQEKPAHTYFTLVTRVPTMQIGVHSTIAKDTLLGDPIE